MKISVPIRNRIETITSILENILLLDNFGIQRFENETNTWLLLVNLTENFTEQQCTATGVNKNDKLRGDYGITTRYNKSLAVSTLCKQITERGKPKPVYRFKLESDHYRGEKRNHFRLRGYCHKEGSNQDHLCYVKVKTDGRVITKYLEKFIEKYVQKDSNQRYNSSLYENLTTTKQVVRQIFLNSNKHKSKKKIAQKFREWCTVFYFKDV